MAFSAAWKGLGKSIGIPGFARGTNFAPGGMAIVGERGPELVNLPRGSQVVPNNRINTAMTGGGMNSFVWNVQTPDANSFRRTQRQMQSDAKRRLGV
jgi:phage-related tail protein